MEISGVPAFYRMQDAQDLDEVCLPSQDLEDAALEQGGHPLARGGFPDRGHRFAGDDHLFVILIPS